MNSEQNRTERDRLLDGAKRLGLSLSEEGATSIIRYLELLDETNKTFNLTRIPRADYVALHAIDSLASLTSLGLKAGARVIDIGTGAGFPGIPVAAARPDVSVTLLDSTLKKLKFIESSASECGITNCSFVHARAEAAGEDPSMSEQFDAVLSRAVAPFGKLLGFVLPFVKVGGVAVAMKGAGFESEMQEGEKAIAQFGCRIVRIDDVPLPFTDIVRHHIVIERVRSQSRRKR